MAIIAGYKLGFAENAIEAKRVGVTYTAFAKNNGIPYSSLISWIKAYKIMKAEELQKEQQ